ncbi:MAG: dethiobiotin synthase [Betaproteobacteria bacterium]|nr:dethiobiotin synthase [Betaproteobacteria bacterium]
MTIGWFVTGTDTEIGKTTFSTLLLDSLKENGFKVVGFKPVASGAKWINGELINDDVNQLREHSTNHYTTIQINPYCFEPAIAPHIAAKEAQVNIDFELIKRSFDSLIDNVDKVVIEGAGGILVPLHDHLLTIDLCEFLALPVIIVVGMRLGCINHALLTEKCILNRGIQVSGWVANCVDPNMSRYSENLKTLTQLMTTPLLAEIPYQNTNKKTITWLNKEVLIK